LVLLTCVDIGPWMHGNADVLMSHIVSSERTSRLPACFVCVLFCKLNARSHLRPKLG